MDTVHLTGESAIHQYADYNYVELVIDMDLTGFTGRAMLKKSFSDVEGVEFTLVFAKRNRPAILKPTLTHAQTSALIPGTYKWDCWVSPESGDEITLLCKGTVTIEAGVTPSPLTVPPIDINF